MSYVDTFITVADDCPATVGEVPASKAKPSVAVIHYELLAGQPYRYTQDDVLFETFVSHKGGARSDEARAAFLAQPLPCLRTSPLAKRYGWGFHFDADGKVAIYGVETTEYHRFASSDLVQLKALRSKRTA